MPCLVIVLRSQPLTRVGEDLVIGYIQSCTSISYKAALIGLQLLCVAMVMCQCNNCMLSSNIACLLNDRQACTMQYKLYNVKQPIIAFQTLSHRCKGLAMRD